MRKNKPTPFTLLLILDGWGLAPPSCGNAITLAKTPVMNYLWKRYPHTTLKAHGQFVGLLDEQSGNSEAGHINLGAGRRIVQDAVYISEAIRDGTFFKNTAFREALKHLRKYKTKLHLMGLLSGEKSPHSSPEHLEALLDLAHEEKLKKVILHFFTDGRDSPQHEAINFLKKLERNFKNQEVIATIAGRFYAMDRKKEWSRTEKVFNALVLGEGEKAESPQQAILRAYNRGETDEFIPPTVITSRGQSLGRVEDNDIIIFFNLRSDRARQLTKAFVQPDFNKMNPDSFRRKKMPRNIRFVAMTDFGPDLPRVLTAFPSRDILETLPRVLRDFRQLYIAETEKYAHVTYFFNGGFANPIGGEERIKVPSPFLSHYDEKPEMSAQEVTKIVLEKIEAFEFDFITVNLANPDMIGHTGNLKAGIKAVKCVDECLGRVFEAVKKKNGQMVVTADHGNIEEMVNLKTGEVDTEHSTNPVPLIIIPTSELRITDQLGTLADVAPTILEMMRVKKPNKMRGKSLINSKLKIKNAK